MDISASNYRKRDVLDDGSVVLVRAIQPDDRVSLSEAFSKLSSASVRSRFFRDKTSLSSEELEYFTKLDFVNHVAIGIGLLEEEQTFPIGIGRYIVDADQPKSAEIALTVDDAYQGIGVGSLMIKHLSEIARDNGIEKFYAMLLSGNKKMLHAIQRTRLPFHIASADGIVEVTIDTTRS